MNLVIALGNPGPKYSKMRHNLGFIAVDGWAQAKKLSFNSSDLYDYLVHKKLVIIKPNTFMNLSGRALAHAVAKWKPAEILIVHDDVELDAAQLRLRNGGGDGGHNGLKSLFEVVPPYEMKRIRIGIGKSGDIPVDEYVLQDFEDDELKQYKDSLKLVSRWLDTYSRYDFEAILNDYSKWKKSYSGGKAAGIKSPKEE